MKIRFTRTWAFLIIILLIVLVAGYIYDPLSSDDGWPKSLSYYPNTGLLRIVPETLLISLNKGDTDVFLPDTRPLNDRFDGLALFTGSLPWSQADNLKIVDAVNQFVWKDTLDGWSMFRMVFNTACQQRPAGFSGGYFDFFRGAFEKGKMKYAWRAVEINPEYLNVAWGDGEDFRHPLLGWKSIELSRLRITAEDEIRIAGENGGKEARSRVKNRCNIHLLLMPEYRAGWLVDYGYSAGFRIEIDPSTGQIIK